MYKVAGSSLIVTLIVVWVSDGVAAAQEIETSLIVGYPQWLKDRYDIYVDYVRGNLSAEIEISRDGIRRLVESDIEDLPWLFPKKNNTRPEYYRELYDTAEQKEPTQNQTCVYDKDELQRGLTPRDMQAVQGGQLDSFCAIKSSWILDDDSDETNKDGDTTNNGTDNAASADMNPHQKDIRLWSDRTVVFVMNTEHSRIIYHAMETIMYMTCVRFEYSYVTNRNHYLYISDAADREYCNGTLGMAYNNYDFVGVTYQNLHLHYNCASYPIVLHLLMHSLGLANEHERVDRNHFITINQQNVNPTFKSKTQRQFVKHIPKTPYQTDSIMHYDSTAWTLDNTLTTILTKDGKPIEFPLLGSIYDFQRINYLYGCRQGGIQSSLKSLTKEEPDYEDDYN